MSVTEYERNQLFTWFEEHMGKERAATMMSLLPPVGWADVATKRDLDALAERVDSRMERLTERLESRFETVDARFDAVDYKFDALEARLATKIEQARSDLQRTFVTWMFAAQGVVVASVGLLLAVLR